MAEQVIGFGYINEKDSFKGVDENKCEEGPQRHSHFIDL